jgi:hypothetical protein
MEEVNDVRGLIQNSHEDLGALADSAEEGNTYAKKKFIALYQARTILSKIGTMPERRLCAKQLKLMKRKK